MVTRTKALSDGKKITHYDSIEWVAEPVDKPTEITRWKCPPEKIEIAEVMMSRFPVISKQIFEGRTGDIRIVDNGRLILATPPRPYEEWKYDFLKIDVCISGPVEEEGEIVRRFNEEKRRSIIRRKKSVSYLEYIKPALNKLAENRLIDGLLGRGSYFGKNGYPAMHDDIDFIILVKRLDKEKEDKIIKALHNIPRFAIGIVKGQDTPIKKGKKPQMSFIIISEDRATHAKGTIYEKYILEDSFGIDLRDLSMEASEELAKEFISLLPKKDNRAGIPRLPK